MLKVNLNVEDRIAKIHVSGTGREILSDCLYVVNTIYSNLGPIDRLGFRELFTAAIRAPDSPVWEIQTSSGEDGIKAVTFHFPDCPEAEDQNEGGNTDD